MKTEIEAYCTSIEIKQEKLFSSINNPNFGYFPRQRATLEGIGIEVIMDSCFSDNFKYRELLSKLTVNPNAKIKITVELEKEKVVKKIV
jgi:hypothetical protein